jgi:hypothetical protein
VSFFILSNAATWAVYDFYPKTFAGLMASYVAAIPFYRPQGDLMYAALFFSIPVLMESLRRHEARQTV